MSAIESRTPSPAPGAPVSAIGLVGLGTMGAALARNVVERGVAAVVHDADRARAGALAAELGVSVAADPASLVASLPSPRVLLLLVPAGEAVDAALDALAPHLAAGDAVIDAGNSFWKDTERRATALAGRGIHWLGCGISGGEEGARHGPSIMAGGDREPVERVAPMLRAIAAREGDQPCFVHAGPGGAGHFVKAVHNGIEYAVMQLIAESYLLLRDVGGLAAGEIRDAFAAWQGTAADSFLLACARRALAAGSPGRSLIDRIDDVAGQKGTGAWATAAALEFGVPAPTLAEAVFARGVSGMRAARDAAARTRPPPPGRATLADELRRALPAASLVAHAQGFALIAAASEARGWKTDLAAVARAWRAGCILRSPLIAAIAEAVATGPADLLAHPKLAPTPEDATELRHVVGLAVRYALPAPAYASALAYLDGYRTARSGANLIEAMRDVFGRHGFSRVDVAGRHHADWPRE